MSSIQIFVYGSLSQGMVHHQKFLSNAQFLGPSYIKGVAYKLEVGYPVVLESQECFVEGELYSLPSSEITLALWDEFHGYSPLQLEKSLFLRKEVEVLIPNSEPQKAYCYFMNPLKLPAHASPIPKQDWKSLLTEQVPLPQKLTEEQKGYVRKLGKSTGRDIVPIQLDIYRQLMNLGLIVDKGRRLALSKLGKDVLKYME